MERERMGAAPAGGNVTSRGFGVAGALGHETVSALAAKAEHMGYATFWANDTPGGDGLAALTVAAAVTNRIRLGVGVIPIDRRPAATILERVQSLGLPEDRLTIGIGSGGLKEGAIRAVVAAASELSAATNARIVIGALGPRMCAAAGRAADGALLNWLTPAYAGQTASLTRRAAAEAGRPNSWVGVYVRVGLTGEGASRVGDEARRYAAFPQYAAHFVRMGVDPVATTATGTPDNIQDALNSFADSADEVIVRAIAAKENLDAYAELLNAAAPRGVEDR